MRKARIALAYWAIASRGGRESEFAAQAIVVLGSGRRYHSRNRRYSHPLPPERFFRAASNRVTDSDRRDRLAAIAAPKAVTDPHGPVGAPRCRRPTRRLPTAHRATHDWRWPCDRGQQRHVSVHFLLADGRRRAVRSGQHRLLHRRHRRSVDRRGRAVVHPGGDAFQLRGAQRLYRKLLAVRSRRRISRGQGSDGRVPGQAFGFRADVRLRAHRADQRRLGGAIHHGSGRSKFSITIRRMHIPEEHRSSRSRIGALWFSPA